LSATAAPAAAASWLVQARTRVLSHMWLKGIGTTAYITAFFMAYFWMLENPRVSPTVLPLTAVDRAVPLSTGWLPSYLSLWVYVSLPPALFAERAPLVRFGIAIGAVCLAGLGLFALWPSAIPPELAVDFDAHPEMALLKGIDASGNACPSMHVATALFSALWLERLLREIGAPLWLRIANILWGVAIIYSTLAVKQHVFLDVVGGVLLGGLGAWLSLAWHARRAGPV
jgi:membrane-associated phospholipid phosphatase